MKNTRFIVSLIAVLVAPFTALATTVDISGTFNYNFGSGAAATFEVKFIYDPSYPLVLVPAGTITDGLPVDQNFYDVPVAGISDLFLQVGNSGWLAATTTGFWIDGNIGVVGASVHDLFGSFHTASGFVTFGSTLPVNGKTHIIDDVFLFGGGFDPGNYDITVTPGRPSTPASVPDEAATGGLTVMGLVLLGVAEIRRRKTAVPAGL